MGKGREFMYFTVFFSEHPICIQQEQQLCQVPERLRHPLQQHLLAADRHQQRDILSLRRLPRRQVDRIISVLEATNNPTAEDIRRIRRGFMDSFY